MGFRFSRLPGRSSCHIVDEDCGDGTTAQMRVTVIGGHEEESESGVTTRDSDFLTVLLRGFDARATS